MQVAYGQQPRRIGQVRTVLQPKIRFHDMHLLTARNRPWPQ